MTAQEELLPLASSSSKPPPPRHLAISAEPGTAATISVETDGARSRLASALVDEKLPKAIHDYKAASHAMEPAGISIRNVTHDPMLYSYLLDPTYSSHRLADVALRRFNAVGL